MSWKDVAKRITDEFPDLAGDLLTGDYVGMARTAISAALGAPNDGDAVSKAIDSDPSILAKLQEIDVSRYRAETERMRLSLQDRESARALQQTALEHGKGEIQERLAYALVGAGFLLVAAVLFVPSQYIDESTRTWAFPFAQSIISMVVGFYFGSTQWANRFSRPHSAPDSFMDEIKRKAKQ